jgi:hypothetical protein
LRISKRVEKIFSIYLVVKNLISVRLSRNFVKHSIKGMKEN